jgi:hypothetical protein
MGIEPTSEAWEACCRQLKNAQIGGILSFFEVLKWVPIGAAEEGSSHAGPWKQRTI